MNVCFCLFGFYRVIERLEEVELITERSNPVIQIHLGQISIVHILQNNSKQTKVKLLHLTHPVRSHIILLLSIVLWHNKLIHFF